MSQDLPRTAQGAPAWNVVELREGGAMGGLWREAMRQTLGERDRQDLPAKIPGGQLAGNDMIWLCSCLLWTGVHCPPTTQGDLSAQGTLPKTDLVLQRMYLKWTLPPATGETENRVDSI